MLDRVIKANRAWHRWESKDFADTDVIGKSMEQYRKEEKCYQDIAHMKT